MAFQQLWWSLKICIKFLRGFSLVFGPTGAGWADAGVSFISGQVWIIAWRSKPSIYLGGGGGEVFVKQIFVWSACYSCDGQSPHSLENICPCKYNFKAFCQYGRDLPITASSRCIPGLVGWCPWDRGYGSALVLGVSILNESGWLLNQQRVSRYLHGQGQVQCQGLQLLEIPPSVFHLGFNLLISHRCSGGKCQGKWRLEEQHSSGEKKLQSSAIFLGQKQEIWDEVFLRAWCQPGSTPDWQSLVHHCCSARAAQLHTMQRRRE